MKAILTKVLPATDTKPTRIKAMAEGVRPVVVSHNSNHSRVAQMFLDKWLNVDKKPGDRVAYVGGTGQLPNGDYCHLIKFSSDPAEFLPSDECLTLSDFLSRRFYREVMPDYWQLPKVDQLIALITDGMRRDNRRAIERDFEMMLIDPRNTYNDSIFQRLQFERGSWSLCAAQDYNVDMRYIRQVIRAKW
jgi:hypothetical protein